jgi:hypothetical protein
LIFLLQAGKKGHFLRYSDKEHRLAVRRATEAGGKFIDNYRWRAGVEATMSQYDRLTGVKHLRVRGFKAVRYCATLKAAGLNLLRAAMVRKAQVKAKKGQMDHTSTLHSPLYTPFPFVKEQICAFFSNIGIFCLARLAWADSYEKIAV